MAQYEETTCSRCGGEGIIVCDCGGSNKCKECEGSGFMECPKCEGSGTRVVRRKPRQAG